MDSGIVQNILWGGATAIVTVVPAIWAYHSNQKRQQGRNEAEAQAHRLTTDEHQRQIRAQWDRYRDHTDKLAAHRTEIEVLKSKLEELPNGNDIREMLDKLESKLSNQLKTLFAQDRNGGHCTVPNCPIHGRTPN